MVLEIDLLKTFTVELLLNNFTKKTFNLKYKIVIYYVDYKIHYKTDIYYGIEKKSYFFGLFKTEKPKYIFSLDYDIENDYSVLDYDLAQKLQEYIK